MLRMWTYDLAREQHADLEVLRSLCRLTLDSGYNALGLYLEHRYAYEATPWAHGAGCLTAAHVRQLQSEFPSLQLVPFVNLLGHVEGLLYTEQGKRYAAERFKGLQADAAHPGFRELCGQILDEILSVFTSDLIHLGGDETAQLGEGKYARPWLEARKDSTDPKAELYADHLMPLCQKVIEAGRTPGLWADMFAEHPSALDAIPKETILFDWQYFKGPAETAKPFIEKGFRTVVCPAIHTYNATWCHLPETETNIRAHVADASALGAHGVCVTTWEQALFGNYETLLPALRGAGAILNGSTEPLVSFYQEAEPWAQTMGIELQGIGGTFGFSQIRSSVKCRFLLYSNPFLLWLHHAEEFCGPSGDAALELADQAIQRSPDAAYRQPAHLLTAAVQFVRLSEQARIAYADGIPGAAAASLAPMRQMFEDLERYAQAAHLRFGGSLADVHRCRAAKSHVETVLRRVKEFGDGSLGYLPAWEILTHPKFMPHDQGSWWLINRWANE